MNQLIKFFIVGFPSPWRWARRKYWLRVFDKTTDTQKHMARVYGIDPQSLIEKGEL
jgi:hypothetical protein